MGEGTDAVRCINGIDKCGHELARYVGLVCGCSAHEGIPPGGGAFANVYYLLLRLSC